MKKRLIGAMLAMAMATTNTVFNFPINGRSVIASCGLNHIASIISSNPNTLPNSTPNMVEKNPQQEIMPARRIFLNLYSKNPPIRRQSPCPASPNIKPNRME